MDTTMLPRPFRDHKFLQLVRALDEEHRVHHRAGCMNVEIHYNPEGFPAKVKVKPSEVEFALDPALHLS